MHALKGLNCRSVINMASILFAAPLYMRATHREVNTNKNRIDAYQITPLIGGENVPLAYE